jgi:hypothetical protein
MKREVGRKNISTTGPLNCRSLDYARDDKGDGGGSIKSNCKLRVFRRGLLLRGGPGLGLPR